MIDDLNLESFPSEFLKLLKLLPLPEVDPKMLPKFVEGELKLWLPARDPRPADHSEVSLCFELNRWSHFRLGPISKFDFCLVTSAALTNLSHC